MNTDDELESRVDMKGWTLWFEFEEYDPSQKWNPETEYFDMNIVAPDGREWALSVWTFASIPEIRKEAAEMGEELSGRYLLPPDLLVERADRKLLENVVADLINSDGLKDEWLVAS